MITCPNCKALNTEGSLVCGACGASLINTENNTQNNRLIDFLNMINLSDHYIDNAKEISPPNIDYKSTNVVLTKFVNESKGFLITNLQ